MLFFMIVLNKTFNWGCTGTFAMRFLKTCAVLVAFSTNLLKLHSANYVKCDEFVIDNSGLNFN